MAAPCNAGVAWEGGCPPARSAGWGGGWTGGHGPFTPEKGLRLLWRPNLGLKLKDGCKVPNPRRPGGGGAGSGAVAQGWCREGAASPAAWGTEGGRGEVHAGGLQARPPFPVVPRRCPEPTTHWTQPGSGQETGRAGRGKRSTTLGPHGFTGVALEGACFTSLGTPAGGQSRVRALWGRQRPGVLSPRSAVSGACFSAPGRGWPTHRCPRASPGDRARAGATCGCHVASAHPMTTLATGA